MFQRVFTVLILVFVVISCSSEEFSKENSDFNQARKVWNDAQINNYSINERVACFCGGPYTWDVFVRNGVKNKVEYDESQAIGQTYDAIFDRARTIEDTFEFIEGLLGRDLASLTISYDETYGYPLQISIDYIAEAVDDEIGYIYSEFEIEN